MKNHDNMIQDLIIKIRSPKNEFLATKIGILAFALGLILYIINTTLFKNSEIASLVTSRLLAIIFCGLLGLDGFVVMIRKELHQIIIIRGHLAVFYGLVWCVIAWSLALYYIYLFINDIIINLS
jgi:hypothetical protein